MTEFKSRKELLASAAVIPLTDVQRRAAFIKALKWVYKKHGRDRQGMNRIENVVDREARCKVTLADTFMEQAAARYAKKTGEQAPTTYGELQQSLGLSDQEAHDVFCFCHHADAKVSAERLANINAGRKYNDYGDQT